MTEYGKDDVIGAINWVIGRTEGAIKTADQHKACGCIYYPRAKKERDVLPFLKQIRAILEQHFSITEEERRKALRLVSAGIPEVLKYLKILNKSNGFCINSEWIDGVESELMTAIQTIRKALGGK